MVDVAFASDTGVMLPELFEIFICCENGIICVCLCDVSRYV